MTTFKAIGTSAAIAAILLSATALASGTRAGGEVMAAAQEDAGSSDRQCLVHVDRQFADGTYRVVRQEWQSNGSDRCRCYVQTGANPQSETIERAIAELLRDRSCADAVVAPVDMAAAGAIEGTAGAVGGSAAAAGGAGMSTIAVMGAAAAALAAGAVALNSDSGG